MAAIETIAVVGASLAGLRAMQALRSRGFGGRLIAIGEEPHPPYDRPPLSKQVLSGEWPPPRTALLRESDEALEVDWCLGQRATGLDLAARRIQLQSGAQVAFDGLVIASGAVARDLPQRPRLPGIHLLRTLEDCLALRAELAARPKVAVIGAGFIGAEVAATCRGLGLEVSLIESLSAPLLRGLGPELGALVGALHRDHGVDLRCGVQVAEFLGGARVAGLRLADGARIAADLVVIGVGAAPATDWLAGSGLELNDGVLCDSACRCTRADFAVAAGDVARWPHPAYGSLRIEHWSNAAEQAGHAAETLLGAGAPFAPLPFVWSDQFDRKIQLAGRLEGAEQQRLVDGSLAERRFVMLFGRAGRLCAALAMNRPRLLMKYRRLLRESAGWEQALRA